MAVENYPDYQKKLAEQVILPSLLESKIVFSHGSMLDIGCGHGGVLQFLNKCWKPHRALGIDLDEDVVHFAQSSTEAENIEYLRADFLMMDFHEQFDLVFFRDVLEHIIIAEKALIKAYSLVKPGGYLYLTYAPFFSPFGGHQHNGVGILSFTPWIQLFPLSLVKKMIGLRGNSYKNRENLLEDVESVFKTRLMVKQVNQWINNLGARVVKQRRSFIRPDYQLKFNLRPIDMPKIYFPGLTELFCTGEEFILQKPR